MRRGAMELTLYDTLARAKRPPGKRIMDGSRLVVREDRREKGRSFVALAFCPVVPIVGWLEEIDATLAAARKW